METKAQANPAAQAPPPDPLKDLQDRLAPQLEEVGVRLGETNEHVKSFIRQNPGTCLLGAAAIGFLAGQWASRR
jgi:ElaB/YqjD/DUF883 family membrane-anchored ribosome-binding protein